MNTLGNALAGVAIGIAIVVSAFIGSTAYNQYTDVILRERAIQGCLELGYEEYRNDGQGSTAVTVNKQAYEFCMEEKGY